MRQESKYYPYGGTIKPSNFSWEITRPMSTSQMLCLMLLLVTFMRSRWFCAWPWEMSWVKKAAVCPRYL